MRFPLTTYLDPGAVVFYVFPSDIIVKAEVNEVEDIYEVPGGAKAVWHYRHLIDPEKNDHISIPNGKRSPDGWEEHDIVKDVAVLEGMKKVNQFLWIDEPVGHAVQLGEECHLTLAEALKHVRPTRKRHLKRRLKQARGRTRRFIAHTWEVNGSAHPGFPQMPLKKVYVLG